MFINLNAMRAVELHTTPFSCMVAEHVLNHPALEMICAAFPRIEQPGVFPLAALRYREN